MKITTIEYSKYPDNLMNITDFEIEVVLLFFLICIEHNRFWYSSSIVVFKYFRRSMIGERLLLNKITEIAKSESLMPYSKTERAAVSAESF